MQKKGVFFGQKSSYTINEKYDNYNKEPPKKVIWKIPGLTDLRFFLDRTGTSRPYRSIRLALYYISKHVFTWDKQRCEQWLSNPSWRRGLWLWLQHSRWRRLHSERLAPPRHSDHETHRHQHRDRPIRAGLSHPQPHQHHGSLQEEIQAQETTMLLGGRNPTETLSKKARIQVRKHAIWTSWPNISEF